MHTLITQACPGLILRKLKQAYTVDCFDDIVFFVPVLAPAAIWCFCGRARLQQKRNKNQEKHAKPKKITRKIIFPDIRNPAKNFTPLFGEVKNRRTHRGDQEQRWRS